MPEVDLTTKLTDGSKQLLARVQARVRQKIYLGPGNVKLTPTEALTRLRAMKPDELRSMIQANRDPFFDELERLLEGAK